MSLQLLRSCGSRACYWAILYRAAIAWVLLCAAAGPLRAQEEAQGEAGLPDPAALESRLGAWRSEAMPLADAELVAAAELTLELVEEQLEAARRAAEVKKEAELAALELKDGPSSTLDQPPPFDFAVLDGVLDRRDALGQAELLANEAIDIAIGELEEAERSRRDVADVGDEEWVKRAALVRVELARQQLQNARKEQETARCRFDLAKQLVPFVSKRLDAGPQKLHAMLDQIEDQQMQLDARRAQLERDTGLAERRWQESQERLESSDTPAARAEVAARRAALESADTLLRLHGDQGERLGFERDIWRHRFAAALDAQGVEVPERSLEAISSLLERQARERELSLKTYRATRRGLGLDLDLDPGTDAGAAGDSGDIGDSNDVGDSGSLGNLGSVAMWTDRHRESLSRVIDACEEDLGDLARLEILFERVKAECTPYGWRLREGLASVGQSLIRAWHFELLVVDDRPITVGKALMALFLILIGYRVSKRAAKILNGVLERRLHISSGSAAALQNLVFYLLLVFFFLWAFQLVGIPLTVFTVLGGVVAIGVGFGSQNIVNNFISGLILLIERPIKVGDLIEVGGVLGSVERIGLRSTRVRAGDNTHVIVPNSGFLEKNVLNWTASDDVIRTEVDVGVAYGSPTEQVRQLIEKALDEEPLALSRPEWDVLFIEFGDNALHFRAYFWIRVHGFLDKLRAGSAVRFRIDALFRDAGISISFPQRDVHLDTLKPLEVRLMDRDS